MRRRPVNGGAWFESEIAPDLVYQIDARFVRYQKYKMRMMMKNNKYTGAASLIALSLMTTATAAPAWRSSELSRTFPAEQIGSYPLSIAASGNEADVYFPQLTTRQQLRYVDQFPVVLMSQGAMVDKEYYSQLAAGVARHGFIVVVPNQRNKQLGNALRYAQMATIREVLDQMHAEDSSPDSPVYGIADPNRLALMGHSFGGASSAFASGNLCAFPFCDMAVGFARPAELRATVLVSSNSGTIDIDTTGIPMAIVGGSEESGRTDQLLTYANLEAPKAFVTVAGANHYGLCDVNVPPGARAKADEADQTVPQAITAARFAYWAGTFLSAHVHEDRRAARLIYDPQPTDGVTVVSQAR
jgi:Chlorophyllase enzyme